ncbi:MAG TPA: 4-(cytidine 5'-diphospho)-2-C-methyl-D-erythritol kinase [Terriglobales bacterium]|jgi:4-diphosphocytidyl-2-C-methyl-D-erythritol kinase|nr:4-(cytidine 5'-diphospho)-2-C-methyl-D-erythritol kinase [Terriglobales bacterium]
MPVTVRSFAKINLGLSIGPLRPDGFHDLRTVYQTIALHDIVHVQVARGSGIEIRCDNPRVPTDATNTCYRIAESAMEALRVRGRIVITIEKRLPVQGGLGAGSANAVAALIGLESALKKKLSGAERLRIAAGVGSDLPLFLVGGTVLGVGHGEEVYPLPDLPDMACVVATPDIGVSTPQAFADWDGMTAKGSAQPRSTRTGPFESSQDELRPVPTQSEKARAASKLTLPPPSDRMLEIGRVLSAWLSGQPLSGVPVSKGRGRAETSLLDLVRTGIENDFERVVFPKYPELRKVKSVLEGSGAFYASLSGSGSAVYGLFRSRTTAEKAVARLRRAGVPAQATTTMTRQQYWKKFLVSSS